MKRSVKHAKWIRSDALDSGFCCVLFLIWRVNLSSFTWLNRKCLFYYYLYEARTVAHREPDIFIPQRWVSHPMWPLQDHRRRKVTTRHVKQSSYSTVGESRRKTLELQHSWKQARKYDRGIFGHSGGGDTCLATSCPSLYTQKTTGVIFVMHTVRHGYVSEMNMDTTDRDKKRKSWEPITKPQ